MAKEQFYLHTAKAFCIFIQDKAYLIISELKENTGLCILPLLLRSVSYQSVIPIKLNVRTISLPNRLFSAFGGCACGFYTAYQC